MSVADHSNVVELLPAYALDCLDEEEILLVSKHMAVCTACQNELYTYQTVVDRLVLATPDTAAPSPDLQRRLLERIQPQGSSFLPRPRASWRRPLADFRQRTTLLWGLASLLLIAALAVSSLLLWQRVNQPDVMVGPGGMWAIPLSGTEMASNASGFIIIGADGRNGALVVDKLPRLESEQEYQLWLIQNGQQTSGAIFSVDQDGYGGTRIRAPESLFEYSAFGVTIEPAGGSPGPTGDKVLGGTLN